MTLAEYTIFLEEMFEENPREVFIMTNEKLKILSFEILMTTFMATMNDVKVELISNGIDPTIITKKNMNTYIQNKLDEFYKKFDRELFKQDEGYFHDREGYKLKHQLLKFIEQSLTDYHNHIVEKWEHDIKLLKLIHKQELDSIALKSLEDFMEWSELRKSLQDTNPKE